jgi:hypothetical protein
LPAQRRDPLARIPLALGIARKIPEGVRFAAAALRFHITPPPDPSG